MRCAWSVRRTRRGEWHLIDAIGHLAVSRVIAFENPAPGRIARGSVDERRARRQENGMHDHRQFGRREGSVSPEPAAGQISVRRTGGARPARLARVGVPPGNPLRCAGRLRSLRRRQRVLLGSTGGARIPAGRRDGARFVQRLVSRTVLAAEGGLPLRLQHAESRTPTRARPPRSGAASCAPGTRAPTPNGWRARWACATAKAAATACARSSRTCRRSTAFRRSRRSDRRPRRSCSRHFQSAGAGEIGSGRASARLLGGFAGHSMVVASGLSNADPLAAHRQDVCQFSDDRLSPAQKLDFIHRLLRREMAEVRMFLDRIEKYAASLARRRAQRRRSPTRSSASRATMPRAPAISSSRATPTSSAVRARMLELARRPGLAHAAASSGTRSCG